MKRTKDQILERLDAASARFKKTVQACPSERTSAKRDNQLATIVHSPPWQAAIMRACGKGSSPANFWWQVGTG
jgi:hypothetical protein